MASEAKLQTRSSVLSCFLCTFEKPHKCNSIDFFALDWLQRRAHCTILIVVYFRMRSFLGKTIKLLWCESWQKKPLLSKNLKYCEWQNKLAPTVSSLYRRMEDSRRRIRIHFIFEIFWRLNNFFLLSVKSVKLHSILIAMQFEIFIFSPNQVN